MAPDRWKRMLQALDALEEHHLRRASLAEQRLRWAVTLAWCTTALALIWVAAR